MDDVNRSTYETISTEFSATRHTAWKCVRDFSERHVSNTSKILDVGCANGKNMDYLRHACPAADIIGLDTCHNFVRMCAAKGYQVCAADARHIPFSDEQFDTVLCIAMFHHMLTDEDRCRTFREILRVLKTGGTCILTCWSVEQPAGSKFTFHEGVNRVPWNKTQTRYYYVYSEAKFREYFQSFSGITIERIYNECGNWILVFRKIITG